MTFYGYDAYLSGPMTGIEEYNRPAFAAAAAALRAAGLTVFNPGEVIHDGWSWEQYMRYDIEQLVKSSAVVMLPGWSGSRGALLELEIAQRLSIPRMTLDRCLKGLERGIFCGRRCNLPD